ncbi:MAG: rhodanese-like domain-containing protein [Phycisphaerales bacterium]|nr:rhodanese-like domain-containing protein [Phycisphaerales bacterium]
MNVQPNDQEHLVDFDNSNWEVSPQQVCQLLQSGEDFLLMDCRSHEEWEAGRINGATCLPLQEMSTRLSELESNRNRAIVIYCRTGRRSAIVAKFLSMTGYPHVRSMAGGIEAWDQLNLEGKS